MRIRNRQNETDAVKALWRWAGTRWVLLVVAASSTVGWVLELRPLAAQWGPVGTWVGGIATAAGVIFAGVQIRDTRLQRSGEEEQRRLERVEHRERMARSVSINSVVRDDDNLIEGWVVDYTIANGGDYPIENVVLVVIDTAAETVKPEDQVGTCLELVLGTMHHKQVLSDKHGPLRIEHGPVFGEITSLGSVLFTDSWGQSWWRGPSELKKVQHPPRIC